MLKKEVKLRRKTHGRFCYLILPLALLANFFKAPIEINFAIFLLSCCLLIIIFENRKCRQSSCILSPAIIKTSYLTISAIFAIFSFTKWTSYNVYCLLIISYVAAWLFDHTYYSLLMHCPGSFTFGEAAIVSHGLTLVVSSCFLSWYKIFQISPVLISDISETSKFLQILLFGCLFLIWTLCSIQTLQSTFKFYATCVIFGAVMYFYWFIILHQDPFVWIFFTCFKNQDRTMLMFFWVIFTAASILFVVIQNYMKTKKASTNARKYFHVIVSLIFFPGIVIDPELLYLASVVLSGIFVILEMMRVLKIPPMGPIIENAFQVFLDEKDSGFLILTHIYLLVGCSCPLWLYSGKLDTGFHMSFTSGVLSVGIGDTMAAVVGSRFGKHKWPNSDKSVEGTIAAIIAQVIVGVPLLFLSYSMNLSNLLILLLAIFTISLLEAKTTEVDNLILPLVMYPFLRLIT